MSVKRKEMGKRQPGCIMFIYVGRLTGLAVTNGSHSREGYGPGALFSSTPWSEIVGRRTNMVAYQTCRQEELFSDGLGCSVDLRSQTRQFILFEMYEN